MPIQITIPLNQLAKKLKSVFPEIALVLKESEVDVVGFDGTQSTALYVGSVGVNVGENPQVIVVGADDIGKIDSLRLDFDVESDGVLKAKYITKSGVEVEKEIAGKIEEVPSNIVYELLGKGFEKSVRVKGKELRDALDEIEAEDSDELTFSLEDGVLTIVNESKISKKLRAKIKVGENTGGGFSIKVLGTVKRIVEGLSAFSNEIIIGIANGGLIRMESEAYRIVVFIAPAG